MLFSSITEVNILLTVPVEERAYGRLYFYGACGPNYLNCTEYVTSQSANASALLPDLVAYFYIVTVTTPDSSSHFAYIDNTYLLVYQHVFWGIPLTRSCYVKI